ncbi:MAG TPA: hypothetical protein VK190_10130 [Pseudoneobacillus sp.]|nr:hypothetical protein [Pseudoneobacillus sp.]
MGATKVNQDKEHESKIGTWISVGVVGAVILITYLVLFGLFMGRY